jgi:hypothetical protein
MDDFDIFTPDNDPYGIFTQDGGDSSTTDITPKGAYYPDTNTFVNTTLPALNGIDNVDTNNINNIDLSSSDEDVYQDTGYSDANGAMVRNPDGTYTYKTWAELDEIAGVPPGTSYDSNGSNAVPMPDWWSKASDAVKSTFLAKDAQGRTTPGVYDLSRVLGTRSDPSTGVLAQLTGAVKKTFTNPDDTLNIGKILQAAGGGLGALAGLLGANKPTTTPSGYQGGIPQLTAVRTAIPQPTRTPYTGKPSMGTRYFTDTQYVAPADAAATRTYQQGLAQQLGQLAQQPVQAAQGGLMAAKGTYLRGSTDGMADELNTSIEGKQPAKLSHGEFVVPADVVSHLGNGNSDAGAKKLYQMMDRIRVARTGTKKQGKQINPDKFMPGGKVGYAQGGIAKFDGGGLASNVPSGTALSSGLTGTEQSLSNWAAPYVTNMLGQGQAIANSPYQAYTGQLTAGVSPLQQQAFQGAQGLSAPAGMGGFTPQSFTSQGTAQQYMNPYLQQALDPQLAEARRQSQITQTQNAGKLTGAGAYGGGRQAIMDAETQRNLGTTLADITGRGYMSAYDKATQQFNTEQQAAQQAQDLTNRYGLNALQQQAQLGQTQRGIEAEDVAAQKAQFEEERVNPYKMVQFQSSLLGGLPLAAQTYNTAQPSWLQSLSQGAVLGTGGINAILETLGIIPPTKK